MAGKINDDKNKYIIVVVLDSITKKEVQHDLKQLLTVAQLVSI